MADPQHPILAYWSGIPLYLRILILALAGLILAAALFGGLSSLWGALMGVLGVARSPDPPARSPDPAVADTIRRREQAEARAAASCAHELRERLRLEQKRREQEAREQEQEAAARKESEAIPPEALRERILGALAGAEKKARAYWPLLLCGLSMASCVAPRGAGDSRPASRPVCFSVEEGRRIFAGLARCKALPERCQERCALAIEMERQVCQAGLRSHSATLQVCRAERDAALGRKCPACPACASVVWPVVAVVSGVVVGVGVGIAVGVAVGK